MARYKSRAKRLSEALSAIDLTPLEDAIEATTEYVAALDARTDAAEVAELAPVDGDEPAEAPTPPTYDPQDAITDATCAAEAVGELQDEIATWKDNIEANFSGTQKYSDLEECESALGEIKDKFESLEAPERPTDPNDRDAWDGYKDALESLRDEIQEGIDAESDVMFPGMY